VTILEPDVSREVIEASVRAARHPGHDPARWALPLVADVDRVAMGAWSLVALDAREALELWLPPHAGEPCHGDTMALGRAGPRPDLETADDDWEGLTLGDAVNWLRSHAGEYATSNPSCWGRISVARDTTWGPLVIAPFGVGDRTAPAGRLVVVDGLHRAIGWAMRRRANEGAEGVTLQVYLAGPARIGAR
jgi:hypothetical protein